MTPFATLEDLAARFPRAMTPDETTAAETMLADASFLLSIWAPGLRAAVDGGNEAVAYQAMLLTTTMVKRSLLAQAAQQNINPAFDSIGETFGPYSQNIKLRSDSGNLWLRDKELEDLLNQLGVGAAVSMRSPGF